MAKHFKAIMAGVISGIVAITTACLGISGTVIGSVLASILYQLLSAYAENTDIEQHKHKIDIDIVYVFPLVVIGGILFVFLLSDFIHPFGLIFGKLEDITNNNLFRAMGLGLLLIGLYPLFNSKNISKTKGVTVIISGILLLLWGLTDLAIPMLDVFDSFFYTFDIFMAIIIIGILAYVCISVLFSGIHSQTVPKKDYGESKHDIENKYSLSEEDNNPRPRTHNRDMPHRVSKEEINPIRKPINHHVPESKFKSDINKSHDSLKFYSNKSNRYKR